MVAVSKNDPLNMVPAVLLLSRVGRSGLLSFTQNGKRERIQAYDRSQPRA